MSEAVGRILIVGAIVLAVVIGCLSAIAGQLYERRKWERKLLKDAGLGLDVGDASELPARAAATRFDRLEQAVDAIAREVERVCEGQRFVTKLLAEWKVIRTPPSPIPGAVRTSPRSPI
jgi:hypothetical protein